MNRQPRKAPRSGSYSKRRIGGQLKEAHNQAPQRRIARTRIKRHKQKPATTLCQFLLVVTILSKTTYYPQGDSNQPADSLEKPSDSRDALQKSVQSDQELNLADDELLRLTISAWLQGDIE